MLFVRLVTLFKVTGDELGIWDLHTSRELPLGLYSCGIIFLMGVTALACCET